MITRDIKNFEGYGTIDEFGNIKRHNSKHIRKTCLDKFGQLGLTIQYKRVLIRNLVAQTFIRDFDPIAERVIYIDGDTTNHHYINLKIVRNDRFKLSPMEAEEIRAQYKSGSRLQSLADKYGVSVSMVSQIINGKRY